MTIENRVAAYPQIVDCPGNPVPTVSRSDLRSSSNSGRREMRACGFNCLDPALDRLRLRQFRRRSQIPTNPQESPRVSSFIHPPQPRSSISSSRSGSSPPSAFTSLHRLTRQVPVPAHFQPSFMCLPRFLALLSKDCSHVWHSRSEHVICCI